MKTMTKFASILVLLLLASPVLLLKGCGSDVAKSEGCPSGSYLANSTDKILIPDDGSFTVQSAVGAPAPAGISLYVIHFVVTDVADIPRNNICVKLFTGGSNGSGTWYTDDTYGTVVTGSGPYQAITAVTNDTGAAFLYWSTPTPAANFATGTTAGKDISGYGDISFNSGALSALWTTVWTVEGEPI